MTAPINLQAVQTIYALEQKKDFFYLQLSPIFLTRFNFDFSIQSLLDIQTKLVQLPEEWDEDELRCLTFYIIEMLARIKLCRVIWQGDFADYHAIFLNREEIILDLPVFENLEQTITDLVFNTAQLLEIDLLQLKNKSTPLGLAKIEENRQHCTQLKNLTIQQRKTLHTTPPSWCASQQQDSLSNYFGQIPTLLEQGHKIKAHTVQANSLLFDGSQTTNCPAEIIFDLDQRLTYEDFESIVNYLYSLRSRDRQTLSIKERRYADHLNHERERSFSHKLSEEILGYPFYISSIFVDRAHLPTRSLVSGKLEILVCPNTTRYVMLCPSIFWNKDLVHYWQTLQEAEDVEEQPQKNLNWWEKITAYCVDHPILVTLFFILTLKLIHAISKAI